MEAKHREATAAAQEAHEAEVARLRDVLVLTGLGVVVPTAAWPAVMVGFLSAVAVDATVSGRLAATVTAVVAGIVAVFAAAAVDVEHSAVLLISLFFGMAAIVITAGRLSDEQHRTIRRDGPRLDEVDRKPGEVAHELGLPEEEQNRCEPQGACLGRGDGGRLPGG